MIKNKFVFVMSERLVVVVMKQTEIGGRVSSAFGFCPIRLMHSRDLPALLPCHVLVADLEITLRL